MTQLAISEVFKGGSIGKGTTVPGDFDVDLVIYTRCKALLCTQCENSVYKVLVPIHRVHCILFPV